MPLIDDLTTARQRRLHQLDELRAEQTILGATLGLVRNDVVARGRKVRIRDKRAGIEFGEADVVARYDRAMARLRERSLRDVIAVFEGFFADVARAWLQSDRGSRLSDDKGVTVGTLRAAASLDAALQSAIDEAANAKVMDLMYKSPPKWFAFLHTHFGFKHAADGLGRFAEMKATRNAHEHTDGRATERYREDAAKGGGKPRANVGEELPVDPLYLDGAITLVGKLIDDIGVAAEATAKAPAAVAV